MCAMYFAFCRKTKEETNSKYTIRFLAYWTTLTKLKKVKFLK